MRLDLTDLRLFVNIQEAGTITGGAEKSHMTLASASERILNMEASLGAKLLIRDRRGVRLAPAGRTLLHHARLMQQQFDRLQGDLGDYGRGFLGHVRMLCNTSAVSEHLPGVLSGFLATHRGISLDLEERPSIEIVAAIREGSGEIGMVSDSVDLEGLERFPFRPDPLVLAVPRDHGLASAAAVGLADLVDLPFVGLLPGHALQEHIAQHARRLGKHLNYRVRLASLESVCRVVGSGIGVCIVPRAVAMRHARSCKLKAIALNDAWAARNLVLCVRRQQELLPPARQLLRHLLDSRTQRGSTFASKPKDRAKAA